MKKRILSVLLALALLLPTAALAAPAGTPEQELPVVGNGPEAELLAAANVPEGQSASSYPEVSIHIYELDENRNGDRNLIPRSHHGENLDHFRPEANNAHERASYEGGTVKATNNGTSFSVQLKERGRFKYADYLYQPVKLSAELPAYTSVSYTISTTLSHQRNSKGGAEYWMELLRAPDKTAVLNTGRNATLSPGSLARLYHTNKDGGSTKFDWVLVLRNDTAQTKTVSRDMALYVGCYKSNSALKSYHHQVDNTFSFNITKAVVTKTITYDANGGSGGTTTAAVTGGSFTPKAGPTRPGYTFAGWKEEDGETFYEHDQSYTLSRGMKLVAQWTRSAVTVSFNLNGGDGTAPENLQVTCGDHYGELPKPTRENYNFAGWYTASAGGSKVESTTTVTRTHTHTLYAHWTQKGGTGGGDNPDNPVPDESGLCTVTFDATGGSLSAGTVIFVSADSTGTGTRKYAQGEPYDSLPSPTRLGYFFNGWYTATTGDDQVKISSTVPDAGTYTLYAHWTKASSPHTHDLGDGTKVTFVKATDDNLASGDGSYYLTEKLAPLNNKGETGIKYAIIVKSGETLNICLNGYELAVADDSYKQAGFIRVEEGGTLNICNCNSSGNNYGQLTRSSKFLNFNGGAVNVYGTFNLYGGSICSIRQANINNSAVCVQNGATFNMHGGHIQRNETNSGSGVYTIGTFNLYGGSIRNNSASSTYDGGGGIYAGNGTLTLSGCPVISGNTSKVSDTNGASDNLRLYVPSNQSQSSPLITIEPGFDPAQPIGVSCYNLKKGESVIIGGEGSGDYLRYFTGENGQKVGVNENNELILNGGSTGSVIMDGVRQELNNDGTLSKEVLAAPGSQPGFIWGGWYTAETGGTEVDTTTVLTDGQTLYPRWTECTNHQHDDNTWKVDKENGTHYKECSLCLARVGEAEHTWGEGSVTTLPTVSAEGEMTYTCAVCGGTTTEDIPKLVTHTVTYIADEHTVGTVSGDTAVKGDTVTLPTGLTRTGYNLVGWVLLNEDGEPTGDTLTGTFTMPDRDVEFQIRWTAKANYQLQPGETIVLEDGTKIEHKSDGTVTIDQPSGDGGTADGTPDTTITLPDGGTVTIKQDTDSGKDKVVVPGGSTVTTPGEDGSSPTTITVGDGDGKVDTSGTVEAPAGSTVEKDGSTVTITGTQGGDIDPDGVVSFPAGTEGTVTVKKEGESGEQTITVPGGGPDSPNEGLEVTPGGIPMVNTSDGELTVPNSDGSSTTIKVTDPLPEPEPVPDHDSGEDGPGTYIPAEETDSAELNENTGEVTVPVGTTVTKTDENGTTTNIPIPEGGGTIKLDGTIQVKPAQEAPDESLFTVTNITEDTQTGSITVVDDIPTLEYRKKGTETWIPVPDGGVIDGLDEGTYEFRYKETETHSASSPTEVIVTDATAHTHVWAEAWTSNDTYHWHECTAQGCDIDYAHMENQIAAQASYAPHRYDNDRDTTCNTCGYVRQNQTYDISGTVTDSSNNAVSTATVMLMQGNTQVASTTTDTGGNYSFTGVVPGLYNVVAQKDGVTKTIMVEITTQNAADQNITMPDGNKNSVVEVKDNTPAVVVGGVDAIAEAETVSSGETVTIKLTVEKKETPADKTEIDSAAQGKTVELYLDLSLMKTVVSSGTTTENSITNTQGKVLAVVVPYDFTNKTDVTVYRKHGSESAVALTALTSIPGTPADRTFYADRANGRITIYADKFSTYAIGYTPEGTTPEPTPPEPGGEPSSPSTYPPTVEECEHGKITVTPRYPHEGDKVTVTLTPDSGYQPDGLTVTDRNGRPVAVTDQGGGVYTFTQPRGKVTVTGVFTKITGGYKDCPKDSTCPLWPYADIDLTAWYHDGIHYCVENGLMNGYGNWIFGPNDNITRAQFAQILHNREGRPVANYLLRFEDVPNGAWYAEAVRWATSQDIVSGYGNGMFGPNDKITREQLAVMLWRYAGSPAATDKELHFADANKASGYALEALRWAVEQDIIRGKGGGILDPKGKASRAEAAAMLARYLVHKK